MGRKVEISEMSHEEVIAYAERCKQQNRDRQNKYYQNTVKNDPVKYQRFLEKCQKNNSKYYHSNHMSHANQIRIEDELNNPTIDERYFL